MFDKKRFKAAMVMAGVTGKDVSAALQIDESTFYRKLNADGNFTREEINALIPLLSLDNEATKDIFFAEKLALNARFDFKKAGKGRGE